MRGKRKDIPYLELCFLTSNEKEKRGGKKKDVKTRKESIVSDPALSFHIMEELG